MYKILILLAFIILPSFVLLSAQNNNIEVNNEELLELEKKVNNLSNKICELENNQKNISDISEKIVSWSGLILTASGAIITVIILVFSIYQFFNFRKLEADITESKKIFEEFIKSPSKINEAIQNMLLEQSKNEIDNTVNYEDVLLVLNRAYNLEESKRIEYSKYLKNCMFNPKFDETSVFNMLQYVKNHSNEDISKLTLELFKARSKDFIFNRYHIISLIFSSKPNAITKDKFLSDFNNILTDEDKRRI